MAATIPSSTRWLDLSRADLEALCDALRAPRVHARTLIRNTHRLLREDPWDDRSLPSALVEEIRARFGFEPPVVRETRHSEVDGAVKLLVALPRPSSEPERAADAEAVLIPEAARVTLCVSSQIGCAQGCVFCHTGRMGLTRNLAAGEIVAQVLAANRLLAAEPGWLAARGFDPTQRVTNVVFMGMGEPLDNADAVADAIAILTDPAGAAVPLRRVTISTAGHLDGLERLLARWPRVPIALSLHATEQHARAGLMPITERFPLDRVRDRLACLSHDQAQPIFVQYTLFAGVNDSPAHAEALAAWCAALPAAKVNLIPFNPFPGSGLRAPDDPTVAAFRDALHRAGLRVMRRHSKGPDIAAACGQLAFR
jgi:23S rRNA (adenine2503-C2)-methyltransferase